MRKLTFLVATALLSCSSVAVSGLYEPVPVSIDLEFNSAFGDTYSTRFSPNAVDFIGCGIRLGTAEDGEFFSFGFCQAADANGQFLSCVAFDPTLLEAVRSISDYSFISFSVNELGECADIGNSTQSFYLPRVFRPQADGQSND